MTITLYHSPTSGPCRAVEMTAEHLGIKLFKKSMDMRGGDHLKPEFLKLNPQHCIPTIDDNGFVLWESRAIQTYLVNKYAPGNPLYPTDPQERAVVDKMLYFDVGNLHEASTAFFCPQAFEGRPADTVQAEKFQHSLSVLEEILKTTPYVAGKNLTVADYSIFSYLVCADEILDYDFADFPKVSTWLQRMKIETPNYKEINEEPLKKLKEVLKSKNMQK